MIIDDDGPSLPIKIDFIKLFIFFFLSYYYFFSFLIYRVISFIFDFILFISQLQVAQKYRVLQNERNLLTQKRYQKLRKHLEKYLHENIKSIAENDAHQLEHIPGNVL